ncbi:hypothetical protein ACWV26_12090 [Rummeliibacillus sp. JY-2-4R]
MKKKELIWGFALMSSAVALLISFSVFSKTKNNAEYLNAKVAILEADYDLLGDIDNLKEKSTLIVKGKFTGNRTLTEWKDEPTNTVTATGSKSEIQIVEVLKGTFPKSQSKKITVYEPAYFENGIYISIEGYNLMHDGNNYLLYLKPMIDDDSYVIVGMYQGKYDLDSPDLVKNTKNIKSYNDIKNVEYFGDNIEGFNKLKKQVKEKYNLN